MSSKRKRKAPAAYDPIDVRFGIGACQAVPLSAGIAKDKQVGEDKSKAKHGKNLWHQPSTSLLLTQQLVIY